MPKPIKTEPVSIRSNFHMTLDPSPYFNPKAVALPVSPKPTSVSQPTVTSKNSNNLDEELLDKESQEVGRKTQQLMDFLNGHYQFRYNSIMGYTEYKDKSYHYMDWTPVDDRSLKGMTMKVRLSGIDARDNDVRRYVQSNMIRLYDPISDYLWDKFDKWDGKDHIRKLARTVPTKNPHWEDWFYTWFLGMVHQWQVGSHAKYGNQAVPLLISMQGYNKSTFCEQLYAQAMQALHRHDSYYFGPAEIQQITASNRKFSMTTATEQFFLAYFEPAKDTREGTWMSAATILDYLKDKVGVSLLRPLNVIAFGRALSAFPNLKKHVTSTTTYYLVVKKEEK